MREWLRDHGLLIVNLPLFLIFFGGMALSGLRVYNAEQQEHGEQAVSLGRYLLSGEFYEARFENWAVSRYLAVLVRVVSELAERVPRCGGDRRSFGLSATARIAGVQAGC